MLKRMVLLLAMLAWMTPASLRASEAPAVHEGTAAAGQHEAKPPLIPDPTNRETQLQALWVLIIFIVLLMILYPTAWRNILAGLKKREQRIRQDIADAEAARKKAE